MSTLSTQDLIPVAGGFAGRAWAVGCWGPGGTRPRTVALLPIDGSDEAADASALKFHAGVPPHSAMHGNDEHAAQDHKADDQFLAARAA